MARQTNHIGDTNKMLTAVEWLWNESLKKELQASDFEQAKEMEKEQIIDAFLTNYSQILWTSHLSEKDAEDFYNETYGNDTKGKI
jgi:hypothetical protein